MLPYFWTDVPIRWIPPSKMIFLPIEVAQGEHVSSEAANDLQCQRCPSPHSWVDALESVEPLEGISDYPWLVCAAWPDDLYERVARDLIEADIAADPPRATGCRG